MTGPGIDGTIAPSTKQEIPGESQTMGTGWTRLFRPRLLPQLAGGAVVLLGILTLIGWIFGMSTLKTVLPGMVSMKVNTAICFILAGTSLLLQARVELVSFRRLMLGRVLAAMVISIALLTLAEYGLGVNLGVDEFFFRESPLEAGSTFPGRMSPASALVFALLATALVTLDVEGRRKGGSPAQYLVLAATVMTLLAFIVYSYGSEKLYLLGPYSTIALHTVIAFGWLCVGILFARPQRGFVAIFTSDYLGGVVARRTLPAAVLLPILVGWFQVMGQRAGLYGLGFGSALYATMITIMFTVLLAGGAKTLDRADAERQKGADALVQSERREHARRVELETLMEGAPAIVWIAHDPECRRITGNRAAQELLRVPAGGNASRTGPENERPDHFQVFKDGRMLPDTELPMQVAARVGKPILEQELEVRFNDGDSLWIYGNAVPLLKVDGTVRGVVAAFVDITTLKHAEQELSQSREHLRGLAARLQAVREEERTRVAREIHDVLAQQLTLLKLDIAWLKRQFAHPLEASKQQSVTEKLAAMTDAADGAITSVQRIAMELRPVVLDTLGLCAAVEWQTKDFQGRTGIKCTARVPENDLLLDRDSSTALFRILQESLTNVARHAQATEVEIDLQREAAAIHLMVRDNGCGIRSSDLSDSHSIGLIGMRERAALLGGQCQIGPWPAGGTAVQTRVPFRPADDADLGTS